MRTAHAPPAISPAGVRARRQSRSVAWLVARLRGSGIDRQLATGTVPWHSASHAARAVHLTGRRSRFSLAHSLLDLIERAEEPPAPFKGAAIRPCREQVRHALPLILAIGARLSSGVPVAARGVAQLRQLLTDGAGPCYTRIHPQALTVALEEASRWLDVED